MRSWLFSLRNVAPLFSANHGRRPARRFFTCHLVCEQLELRCVLSQVLLTAEGFAPGDYPTGSNLLNAAPLKAGFDGPWNGSGQAILQTGSLDYPGYGAAGGNFARLSGSTRVNRAFLTGNNGPLGNYIDPAGHLDESRDGTPLYLAFLMRPNGVGPNAAFGLYKDGSTLDFRQFHIGYTSANHFEAIIDPTGETADLGPGNTGVNLFVVRVDFADGADVISVWHNPTLGGAEPPPDAQFTDFTLGFDNLGLTHFNGGAAVDYDEIRLGSSWAGVTSADSLPLVQGTQALHGINGLPPGGVSSQYSYDFFPFVDTFGQYSHLDWANKIHSLDELIQSGVDEAADLAAHPGPTDWDSYGGWAAGPQLTATGFFRVQKYQGRWSFVDPLGRLFFSNGITGVNNPIGVTGVTNRENYFADLPLPGSATAQFLYQVSSPVSNGYYAHQRPIVMDFAQANRLLKYGADYQTASLNLAFQRLQSWGMNTIGAFTAENVLLADRTPYTQILTPSAPPISATYPDFFDPAYVNNLNQLLQAQVGQTVDDPYNIGYYVHNEPNWTKSSIAETQLGIDTLHAPATRAAKSAFRDQLEAKYGTIGALNAQWGTNYASWVAVLNRINVTPNLTRAGADLTDFYRNYIDQYFRTTRDTIRAVAPNQLYLGCKFAGGGLADALRASATYADVVSIDEYRATVNVPGALASVDVPLIIGEFSSAAKDTGLFGHAAYNVADQTARASGYPTYVQSALTNPRFVGVHWFRYSDGPTAGILDGGNAGRNNNWGFLTVTDTPYNLLVDAARTVNDSMYATRFGAAPSGAGTDINPLTPEANADLAAAARSLAPARAVDAVGTVEQLAASASNLPSQEQVALPAVTASDENASALTLLSPEAAVLPTATAPSGDISLERLANDAPEVWLTQESPASLARLEA